MTRIAWSLHFILAVALASTVDGIGVDKRNFKNRCLAFKPHRHIRNSRLGRLEYIAAGQTVQFPDNDPSCNRESQAVSVDLCRVALSVSTSHRSSFVYELWLPEDWNGRTLGTGNGGLDGCSFVITLGHLFMRFLNVE